MANEENRDYQINQLSKRLSDNCIRIIDSEIDSQINKEGNLRLLGTIRDVILNSCQIDF